MSQINSLCSHPNIVFIHVDQWRGDCLSIDGHPVVHTPYLDELAAGGVRFRRAYASCPTCIPARVSLMTGLTPEHHGFVGYQGGIPWEYPTTLAGEFTRNGYQTHAVGKLHAYPERNKLGFEAVELHDGYLHLARQSIKVDADYDDDYVAWLKSETGRAYVDYFEHGINCNSVVARPWPMEERLHPTNWVVTRGIDFLSKRDKSRPFFLYLSFHRPHPPYDPPAWALDQYLNAHMPPLVVGNWEKLLAANENNDKPDSHCAQYRPDVYQRARAGYYGHMTHIDHQINRFLELLKEYGLHDDTWVVFTSDHGEMMGDHRLFRKGYPYEGSARLPLILKGPTGSGLVPGAVCDTVVELRDIMPTLLDCAGLPKPDSIDGQSFLPNARSGGGQLRPWLHGEHPIFDGAMHWITDGCEKYIWHSGSGAEQLFNLSIDPAERHDQARKPTPHAVERLKHWRGILVEVLRGREEGFVDASGGLIVGRPITPTLRSVKR